MSGEIPHPRKHSFCEHLEYYELIQALTHYRWGFLGSCTPSLNIEFCMPNKLFEYIAAGLPMIVLHSKRTGKFVTKYGMGIHVEHPSDVNQYLDDAYKYRENVLKHRDEFWMEDHIGILEDLYKSIL